MTRNSAPAAVFGAILLIWGLAILFFSTATGGTIDMVAGLLVVFGFFLFVLGLAPKTQPGPPQTPHERPVASTPKARPRNVWKGKEAYDEVGGLNDVKAVLSETIELPLQRPDLFEKYRVVPPTKGLLLYGPPGCGKTLLAKSIAAKGKVEFVYSRSTDVFTKYYGESASRVRKLFSEARQKAPCVLFFDEIDALVPIRGMADQGTEREDVRVTSEFLAQLDGLTPLERVIVIAATNRPEAIDPAMLRPGRFDKILYVPPPDMDARMSILARNMEGVNMSDDVNVRDLAARTEGYSGADIVALCREAKMFAMKAEAGGAARPVSKTDFDRAINLVKPSIDKSVVARYELFARDFRKAQSS